MTWDEAYALLTNREADATLLCTAITTLGKPFDANQVKRAAPVVATYLDHPEFLVRYQAVWFLGCWSKLREYLPSVIRALQVDEELDNRAFAARCAGQILKTNPDASAVRALLDIALSDAEDVDVRTASYSALLYAVYGKSAAQKARDFGPTGTKSVKDFDMRWLSSLEGWLEQLRAPEVTGRG